MALLQISEPGQSPVPHQFKRAAGIDLGTTNSLVAAVNSAGHAQVITDESGQAMLPSIVHYSASGADRVGSSAAELAILDPRNTLASFKRYMGRGSADTESDSRYHFVQSADAGGDVVTIETAAGEITPVNASAEILRSLAQRAESRQGGQLDGVVITVPAYFDDAQRQATRDAAKLAGLKVLRLINEPTAAAVAYGLDNAGDRNIAVYDLGGGTFDISILQLSEGVFEVLATGGDAALGGDDVDQAIADWVLRQMSVDSGQLSANEYRHLLELARSAKQSLSEQESVGLSFKAASAEWVGEVSRAEFNDMVQPLVERTLQACRACVEDAGINVDDIADVVMVGGSTRIPLVREQVGQLFGQQPRVDVDPDQVVALGAAIQADSLVGNQRGQDLLLLDVIPLSLGMETMGGLVEKIIHRNTPIPATRAQEFTTYKDGQTAMAVHVLQGERELVSDCRSLARFELKGIPPMVAGAARMLVTFSVDADGILDVSAEETTTGVKASIQVKPSYGLDEAQITEMLKASYAHASEDRDARMLVEQQVDARGLLESVQIALQEDGQLLSADERSIVDAAIEHLREVSSGTDASAISNAITELGQATEEFAARRMNQSIRQALQGKSVDEIDSGQ